MDWKNHPVIIAVTAGAVTVAFCVTTILPIWTKVLENRVDEYSKEITTLNNKVKTSEKRSAFFEKRNKTLAWDGIFDPSSPYPKGFKEVKIGDPSSKIYEIFKGADIEVDKEVPIEHIIANLPGEGELFHDATYFLDSRSNITNILYFYSSPDKFSSPLEDINGELGPTGKALLDSLKNAHPNSPVECKDDYGQQTCKVAITGYDISIDSKSYHLDIN